MVQKFLIYNLRNPEYYQFVSSSFNIFGKYAVVHDSLRSLHEELEQQLTNAEAAILTERGHELVRQKNEMDRRRDRLHSKLFNYLKSILYDDQDVRFDDAQVIMRVVKEVGNPNNLAENAQSALLIALGNKLEPLHEPLRAIEADPIVDDLMEANRQFIELEKECRLMFAQKKLGTTPPSMSAVRKQTDPIYRAIVNAINANYAIPSKKEEYKNLVAEMNVLVKKYDDLLAARKREKKEKDVCEVCG